MNGLFYYMLGTDFPGILKVSRDTREYYLDANVWYELGIPDSRKLYYKAMAWIRKVTKVDEIEGMILRNGEEDWDILKWDENEKEYY